MTMPPRMKVLGVLTLLLCTPAILLAQLTHGKKPVLSVPYATKSAANSPSKVSPPEGFLPTVPAGFKINVFATGFKRPRWMIVAPNQDIFVADTGTGVSVALLYPHHIYCDHDREMFSYG